MRVTNETSDVMLSKKLVRSAVSARQMEGSVSWRRIDSVSDGTIDKGDRLVARGAWIESVHFRDNRNVQDQSIGE